MDTTTDLRGSNFRLCIWIFLAFSILYIGVTRGHLISTDEVEVYQAARSLWEEGNLSINSNHGFFGKHGKLYSERNSGQSIAALPLYGLGKALHRTFEAAGRQDWIRTFAGASLERQETGDRWGGDIEIFFVNLFNCFITALLCAVFFAFSRRLGVSIKWSLIATALLGLTTYITPYSTTFLQQPGEALFILWSFYFLFSDKQCPSWVARLIAGGITALMLQFRFPAVFAVPGLVLYHLWVVWERRPVGRAHLRYLSAAVRQMAPFLTCVAFGFALHSADQYIKFETLHLTGNYGSLKFDTPLFTGLYGLLLSPGDSIFLFTPLLVLLPWTLSFFGSRFPSELFFILFQALFYLLTYGTFHTWEGLWCFGPRLVAPLIPLLLLPLGPWMEHTDRKAWLSVAPLALAGLWMQIIHVAVNFWYVDLYEKYLDFQPSNAFLFIPEFSPILAHSKALLAADSRVDMWLINVYRDFGVGRLLVIALPLFALFAFCLLMIGRYLRAAERFRAVNGREKAIEDSASYLPNAEGPGASRKEKDALRPTKKRGLMFGLPAVSMVLCLACWAYYINVFNLGGAHTGPETSKQRPFQIASSQNREETAKSPEAFLELSLRDYYAGRFPECITAAKEALKLKPEYDPAYNNICACYNRLGQWDDAIAACRAAVAINPNNQLAKNNLAWAFKRKNSPNPGEKQ
jgi:tetratricopeptide (TPR) repeat protein